MILVPFRHYPFRFNGYNLSLNKRKTENGNRKTIFRFQFRVLSFQFVKHPLCRDKDSKKSNISSMKPQKKNKAGSLGKLGKLTIITKFSKFPKFSKLYQKKS